jgi:peptidoglycan hydrolase-like protein with peptidoglycan-binding domain
MSDARALLERAAGASTDGSPPVGRPRRGRWAAAAALAAAALAAVWLLLAGGGAEEGGRARGGGGPTATVSRQTLVEREDVDGTLGYSGKRTVLHRSESGSGGGDSGGADPGSADPRAGSSGGESSGSASTTLTKVASAGSVVRRGGVLYRANGKPVVLMYGSRPAFRRLAVGVADGDDVLRLEANLVALGFGDGAIAVDRHFSDATAEAVRDWQDALGLRQTGAVELGRIVFLPGARRVGAAKADPGMALADGAEVVETTSTTRVVKVELEASNQALVREGGRVTVTLPDGRTVNGRISSVGGVAREQGDSGGGLEGGETGTLVIDVTVRLGRTRGTGRLDQAPVTVGIARESRKRVLAAPVTALLARAGGGYAVEVVERGSRRTVPVETGLFADGLVEISGRGISDGTRVAVAG